MRESAAARSEKYVTMTTESLSRLKTGSFPANIKESQARRVIDLVQAYVDDAKHYRQTRKHVSSLACVAYAEGLLDALKFLELVEF